MKHSSEADGKMKKLGEFNRICNYYFQAYACFKHFLIAAIIAEKDMKPARNFIVFK